MWWGPVYKQFKLGLISKKKKIGYLRDNGIRCFYIIDRKPVLAEFQLVSLTIIG